MYEIYDTDKTEIGQLSQKLVALTVLKLEVCSFYERFLLDCCNKLTQLSLTGKDILMIIIFLENGAPIFRNYIYFNVSFKDVPNLLEVLLLTLPPFGFRLP